MACWSTKVAISLKRVKIEEKLLCRAYRKSSMLFRFFGSSPYFYFRFRLYGHRDGRFCLIFARTSQQSVLDGTNGLSSFKPCAYCRIVHRADIFAIAQLSCFHILQKCNRQTDRQILYHCMHRATRMCHKAKLEININVMLNIHWFDMYSKSATKRTSGVCALALESLSVCSCGSGVHAVVDPNAAAVFSHFVEEWSLASLMDKRCHRLSDPTPTSTSL